MSYKKKGIKQRSEKRRKRKRKGKGRNGSNGSEGGFFFSRFIAKAKKIGNVWGSRAPKMEKPEKRRLSKKERVQ